MVSFLLMSLIRMRKFSSILSLLSFCHECGGCILLNAFSASIKIVT